MRRPMLLAAGLLIITIPNAHAANCDQGSLRKRVACLDDKVKELTARLDTLAGQTPKLDNVVIQWVDHPNSCITYQGNNLLQVVDTCVDPNRNRFVVRPYHQ